MKTPTAPPPRSSPPTRNGVRRCVGERRLVVSAGPAVLVAVALVLSACSGGTDQTRRPGRVADDLIGDRAAATDEVFAEFGDGTPGCAVGVLGADGGRFDAAYGDRDIASGAPIERDTVFDVASVSKQFTAGAVALLVLDGEVSLEDDITAHVGEIGPFDEPITIGDLVHHTSGLPDYTELLDADIGDVTTMGDALDVIASPDGAPTFAPGTRFEYSNTNYVLLALIVERISELSMAEFATTRIFEPLQMDASMVRDDQGELLDAQAIGYVDSLEGGDFAGGSDSVDGDWVPVRSAWRQTGDGAVHSTATDLLRWAELFVAEPSDDGLGSREWLEVMLEPGDVADGDVRYGGGLEITGDGRDLLVGHGGSWAGYGSALLIRPVSGVAVAVTCNVDGVDGEDLARRTMRIWE